MSKRLKATINPAVLVWARETAGYAQHDAADKLGVDAEKLAGWETGDDQPTIAQLRKMAELYKRPLAVMYLSVPPLKFEPMHDFRRLPDAGGGRYSPGLTQEIRVALQRRTLALELIDESGETSSRFTLAAKLHDNPDIVGSAIRGKLGVTYALQAKWRDERAGFLAWRTRIEQQSVLIFQASRFEPDEASGFALWDESLPLIVVNRKDVYPRRTFSLLHELAHLMLHQSGVSDLNMDSARAADDAAVEVFCNQVAAAALMPRTNFLAEAIVAARGIGRHAWSDDEIRELAKVYSVSREAIVRRLVVLGRATDAFYGEKRAQYNAEFQEQRRRQKEAKKPIPRNMPRETIADFGHPLVRLVLEQYHQDRLTLSEVSGYLGVKARHVADIEQQVGVG